MSRQTPRKSQLHKVATPTKASSPVVSKSKINKISPKHVLQGLSASNRNDPDLDFADVDDILLNPLDAKENSPSGNSVFSFATRANLQKYVKRNSPLKCNTPTKSPESSPSSSVASTTRHSRRNLLDRLREIGDGEDSDNSSYESAYEAQSRMFKDLEAKTSSTSNNTLSELPPLSTADAVVKVSQMAQKHIKEKELLYSKLTNYFPQWRFELFSGFNIVVYGYGSKISLLKDFATSFMKDCHRIIINGYHPNTQIKTILTNFLDILGHSGPMGSKTDQLHLITEYLSEKPSTFRILLVIHNIDAPNFRNREVQTIIAAIAKISQVLVIASVDHINAPLLWAADTLDRLNFLWHDATTFAPYTTELSFEEKKSKKASGSLHVLKTLSESARKLYVLILSQQLAFSTDGTEVGSNAGIREAELFRKASQQFITSNNAAFQGHLGEFKDHGLICVREGGIIEVPFDEDKMRELKEALSSD